MVYDNKLYIYHLNYNKNYHILVPHTNENCTITARVGETAHHGVPKSSNGAPPEFRQDSHLYAKSMRTPPTHENRLS